MDLGLSGRWALITGASQGIGEGLAASFAQEGVNLHLTARNADRLEAIAGDVRDRYGVEVVVHPLDLTQPGTIERLVAATGAVDILVNNAGVVPSGDLQSIDAQAWRQGWELKVFGYISMCRAMYPLMKQRGQGVIVNNIGNAGERFDPEYIAGSSANASLMAFTRALGGPSLKDGIRVLGVNPGPVDTDRIYKMLKRRAADWLGDENRFPELQARYPLGRPAHVREVTDTIVFLASDRSGYTTGTIITVDGGIASQASII